MNLSIRKRLSIIVENAYRKQIVDLIKDSGAGGFTIYKGMEGTGNRGIRGDSGMLGEFYANIEVVTITSAEVSETILKGLADLMDDGAPLVVHVIDVNVIRGDYFK
jgi:PII-like signaling protein